MNNEKPREDKLREAAEKIFNESLKDGYYKTYVDTLINFAKSKEAAEYHQSLQPVVDVEEFKHQFEAACVAIGPITKERIWKLFIPYLQPTAPESDAVELILELILFCNSKNEVVNGYRVQEVISRMKEYKQSKTKSDEQQ